MSSRILSQFESEAVAAKARHAATSSAITHRIISEFATDGSYCLSVTRNWHGTGPVITIWISKHTWVLAGSPEDIALKATSINNMAYQYTINSILYTAPSRTWDIRLEHSYAQKLTGSERNLLSDLGKIRTETSEYTAIVC